MKKTNYSIKKLFKKGIATLLTASMVVTAVQAPAFADNVDEEVTESSASVTGLVNKKITLELVSDELKEAALTAIRENRLFDAQDYLAATGDNQKALREYEAFFNENPGLYVVDAPESVVDTLSGEDAELRIFVQKDAKMAKVDLTASPSEITREDSTESKNVEFRYGTDKDIILYEPASNVDTLVNGGEDAYYIEPEQEIGDNSDYELTGNEKITFMFVNSSEGTVRFTLKVDGVTYDKVEVGGREAALKKIIAEAGTKKSTEETTVAETTVAETTAVTEETTVAETTVAETTAVTAVTEETTVADETTAAEVQEVETEAPAEETTAEGTEIANADTDSASADTEETTAAVEETAAETEAPVADTDAEVKEEAPAEVTEEPETEATIPEKIAEAIGEAFGGAGDAVLGRMTVYADTIVGEGVEFEVEENAPAAGDSEEAEDKDTNEVVAETVEAADGEDTATEAEEVNEETTAAVEVAADDNTTLAADTTALQIEVSEGLSEDEAENQVEETVAQEVTVVETEPETVAETQAVKETIAKDDETKAAKVATSSEITEYDDFAKELIAGVKEEVLQDKEAAKENIKVAKIAQYTINELGKIHYEMEVDGFNVDVFAAKDAFGDITPELEVKKLLKPEEATDSDNNKKTLSDEAVKELKANDIYDNSQSLDIRFLNGNEEVEPSKPVSVKITINDEDLLKNIDATSLEVHHLKETDDTLKTEKVAATEDVTLLDKNDEEIKDSDLETDAEETEEDEEDEVEVASAVAVFEVESFSLFTIVWRDNDNDKEYTKIKVHYIDSETGKPLFDNRNGSELNLADYDSSITLEGDVVALDEDIAGTVTSHVFLEARLGSKDGQKITSIKRVKAAINNTAYVDYYDGDVFIARNTIKDKLVPDDKGTYDKYGNKLYCSYTDIEWVLFVPVPVTKWKELSYPSNEKTVYKSVMVDYDEVDYAVYSGQRYEYVAEATTAKNDIYFIYGPEGTQSAPDPKVIDLGAPTADKSIKPNNDGTYTLTLSVTGKSKAQTEKTKANVVVVLDLSNSMIEEVPVSGFYSSTNGNYYELADGSHQKLWVDHWLWGWKEASDGTRYKVYEYKNGPEFKGQRYSYLENGRRIDIAKTAIKSLAETLLANNNSKDTDAVQIGLVTFGTTSKVYAPTNDVDTFNDIISGIDINENAGTNWEAGLLDANGYSFGYDDDDPVYVIFVSDGNPTYRLSRAPYIYGDDVNYDEYKVYGTGSTIGGCLSAAQLASEAILKANKKLYTVNAFSSGDGSENASQNMKALFEDTKGKYSYLKESNHFDAENQAKLNEAFGSIIQKIEHDLSYKEVTMVDGISDFTATLDVLNVPEKFTYSITERQTDDKGQFIKDEYGNFVETVKKDDDAIERDPILKKNIKTAQFVNKEIGEGGEEKPVRKINWKIGNGDIKNCDESFMLQGGLTYNVSFTVWPEQEAYDKLANIENGMYGSESEIPKGFVKLLDKDGNPVKDDNGKFIYVYQTNTGATVTYKTVDTVDNKENVSKISEPANISTYPYLDLTDDKLSFQKKWILDDATQKDEYITDESIKLNLQKDNEYYYPNGLTLNKGNSAVTESEDGKVVTWTWKDEAYVAPGILVTKDRGYDTTSANSKVKVVYEKKSNTPYFMLDKGHDYKFVEPVGKAGFDLQQSEYHPMLINGDLKNVKFVDSQNGHEVFEILDDSNNLTTLVAENKFTALKVSKKYTGNMATVHDTTFRIQLYDLDGSAKTFESFRKTEKDQNGNDVVVDGVTKTYDEVEKLNESKSIKNLTKVTNEQGLALYEFTISKTNVKLNQFASMTIMLPANVKYTVEEVVDNKPYENYKPRWGVKINRMGEIDGDVKYDTKMSQPLKMETGLNTIYFINELTAVTPTGFGDNAYPFVALALAGFGSLAFLAYDFKKRRLFED